MHLKTFFPALIFVDHVTFVYINKCEVIKYILVSIICEILFWLAVLKNILCPVREMGGQVCSASACYSSSLGSNLVGEFINPDL
jgi:hypothetical protein